MFWTLNSIQKFQISKYIDIFQKPNDFSNNFLSKFKNTVNETVAFLDFGFRFPSTN